MAVVDRDTVVVAGGAGFIGSHLCERLVDRGSFVVCIDNLHTGTLQNLRSLDGHPRFSFVHHDVTAPIAISGPVHRIFNLACPASPVHYQEDPVATLRTCVLGACNLLDLARTKKARILQASTSEVYGDPEIHPQPEHYRGCVNITGPRACYDEGKRAAETLFFDYQRMYGLEIKVARIFNTYGPRMLENDGRVVSNLIVQALRGAPLTIYGDGSQTRSFCYVDDLVNGLELLMDSAPTIMGPVNLGNPSELSIAKTARTILEMVGSPSDIVHRPLPVDDPRRRRPVIDEARNLLGWSPRIPLETGLRATIDDFAARLSTGKPSKRRARAAVAQASMA
ncbi:UDP-glucuronate decarboxylase [Constrictibacter sp. MBR-5]|jgi:UDP-glucuronate decarboxylase|uniref:UDP-glucuronic acid decarboxylase family protein n=1 Tax=Constrictibacter sp. MBR-5 TaxID=3156467 RepID=UPI003396EDEF